MAIHLFGGAGSIFLKLLFACAILDDILVTMETLKKNPWGCSLVWNLDYIAFMLDSQINFNSVACILLTAEDQKPCVTPSDDP